MNEPHHGAFIKPAHQASRHHHFYANSGAMAGPPSAPTAGGLPYSHLPSARPTGLQVPNRSGGVPMNAGGEHMMVELENVEQPTADAEATTLDTVERGTPR